MFFKKVVFLAFLSILFETPGITARIAKCLNNLDCSENEFCYTVTLHCAPCQKDFCKQFDREKSLKVCPHEYTDCGPCREGYSAEMVYGSDELQEHSMCYKNKVVEKESMGLAIQIPAFIVIGIFLIVVIYGAAKFIKRHKKQRQSSIPSNVESADCNTTFNATITTVVNTSSDYRNVTTPTCQSDPLLQSSGPVCPPPYNVACNVPEPSAPLSEFEHSLSKDTDPLMHDGKITEKEENLLVEARPFLDPDYVKKEHINDGGSSSDSGEEDETYTPDLPIFDDDTQPSSWTPGHLEQTERTHPENVTDEGGVTNNSDETQPINYRQFRMVNDFRPNVENQSEDKEEEEDLADGTQSKRRRLDE